MLRIATAVAVVLSLAEITDREREHFRHQQGIDRADRLVDLTLCHADHQGVSGIRIRFADQPLMVAQNRPALGWAQGSTVTYWTAWALGDHEEPTVTLEQLAAHEVCHLSGIRDEGATWACARRAIDHSDCQ